MKKQLGGNPLGGNFSRPNQRNLKKKKTPARPSGESEPPSQTQIPPTGDFTFNPPVPASTAFGSAPAPEPAPPPELTFAPAPTPAPEHVPEPEPESEPASAPAPTPTPVFASAPIQPFVEEESNAAARYKKETTNLQDANEDLYNKIAERDAEIDELKKEVSGLKKGLSDAQSEANAYKKDARLVKKELEKEKDNEIKHLKEELEKSEGRTKYWIGEVDQLTKEGKANKELAGRGKYAEELEKEVAREKATNFKLHQDMDKVQNEVKQLETEKTSLEQECNHIHDELSQAHTEFETIFNELGPNLGLSSYFDHIRDLMSTGGLQRTISQTSSQQAQAVGSSLLEEFEAAGEDDDPTLQEIVGPDTHHNPLSTSTINTIYEIEAVAPEPPAPLSRTRRLREFFGQPAFPVSAIPDGPVYKSQDTQTDNSRDAEILKHFGEMLAVGPAPSGLLEAWQFPLPWWLWLVLLGLFGVWAYALFALVGERHLWLAANDASRARVVAWGSGTVTSGWDPVLFTLEGLLGVRNGMLG